MMTALSASAKPVSLTPEPPRISPPATRFGIKGGPSLWPRSSSSATRCAASAETANTEGVLGI